MIEKPKKIKLSTAKKNAWDAFSIYIRTRDCIATTGCSSWGLCITCGKRLHFKLLQAGHFVAGRHNVNLFSERGTHAQCYYCNVTLKGNTLEYRRKIIELYGDGTDVKLEEENKSNIKFTVPYLQTIEKQYKDKTKELLQGGI